ncbi:hypothetical protein RLIN73S_00768 [Rhodanobacter lindaniclasticus]
MVVATGEAGASWARHAPLIARRAPVTSTCCWKVAIASSSTSPAASSRCSRRWSVLADTAARATDLDEAPRSRRWKEAREALANPTRSNWLGPLQALERLRKNLEPVRACEKIARLLRTPPNAPGGGALRENRGHLARRTPCFRAACLAGTPGGATTQIFTSSEPPGGGRRGRPRSASVRTRSRVMLLGPVRESQDQEHRPRGAPSVGRDYRYRFSGSAAQPAVDQGLVV